MLVLILLAVLQCLGNVGWLDCVRIVQVGDSAGDAHDLKVAAGGEA